MKAGSEAAPMSMAVGRWRLLLVAAGCLVALLLITPTAMVLVSSFTSSDFLAFPPTGFSTRWYDSIATDPAWRDAGWTSIAYALAGSLIATTIGTCAALAVSRLRRGRTVWRAIFIAPLVLPSIVYALGLFFLFDEFRAVGSAWPIILGQAILATPLAFLAVAGGVARLNPNLSRAAASLGAPWPVVLWRVELPLLRGSIAAALIFTLGFCFDEVVIALFLAAPGSPTLPVQIFTSALEAVSPAIAAAGTIVMAAGVVLFVLAAGVRRLSDRRSAS